MNEIRPMNATDLAMFKALSVIATTQHIRSYLQENDPKALRQVEDAIMDAQDADIRASIDHEQVAKLAAAETPLAIGQRWRNARGPWPSMKPHVRILDVKDGWVRYYVNDYMPDEREREEIFRGAFPQLVEEVGALLAESKA